MGTHICYSPRLGSFKFFGLSSQVVSPSFGSLERNMLVNDSHALVINQTTLHEVDLFSSDLVAAFQHFCRIYTCGNCNCSVLIGALHRRLLI